MGSTEVFYRSKKCMYRIMRTGILISVCLLASCGNPTNQTKELDSIDRFEVQFINDKDTLDYVETDTAVINQFRSVLKEKTETVDCRSTGLIHFKTGDQVKFTTYFSVGSECPFLFFENKQGYRLNYKAGMYLDNIMPRLKRKK
jgi:hypothetical protein